MIGASYYIQFFLTGRSILSIYLKHFALKDKMDFGVLGIGIPAALGSFMMSISQIVVNNQMACYGDMARAGAGAAMKVKMMTGMVCIGLRQGIQPLLGYCVGAKKWDRH